MIDGLRCGEFVTSDNDPRSINCSIQTSLNLPDTEKFIDNLLKLFFSEKARKIRSRAKVQRKFFVFGKSRHEDEMKKSEKEKLQNRKKRIWVENR